MALDRVSRRLLPGQDGAREANAGQHTGVRPDRNDLHEYVLRSLSAASLNPCSRANLHGVGRVSCAVESQTCGRLHSLPSVLDRGAIEL